MIKDITIGQHFPGNSFIHKLDPRIKIILVIIYIIMVFLIRNAQGLVIPISFMIFGYFVSKIPFKVVLRSLKPMLPIILFTSILNMFFLKGDVIFSFWIFEITKQGIIFSAIMAIRLVCLIAGTSLLTYTTSPIDLTDAIERLLNPLKKIKVPVHELSMMMTIALRFIPTLVEETDKIMSAQKARGADMETGNLMQRIKAMVPILIPLFVSAFRRADELAMAMECRCYQGGDNRTKMKQLHYHTRDFLALAVMGIGIAGIVATNIYFPAVF